MIEAIVRRAAPIAAALPALLAIVLGSLAGLGCSGGGAEGGCPETATCGGDPTGDWLVDNVCEYSPSQPAQPLSFLQIIAAPEDPTLAPVQPMPTTSGDWCSMLFLPSASPTNVTLWHGAALLTSGNVSFRNVNGSQTYAAELTFTTPATTHFTPACIQSGGLSPTCGELATAIDGFYKNAAMQVNGTSPYRQLTCTEASDHGCDCNYTYEVDVTDTGTWAVTDGVLTETSQTYLFNCAATKEYQPTLPVPASYCSNGGLTLTGHEGASLYGILGLRMLTMHKWQPPPPPANNDGGAAPGCGQ
jgi:hypothetical protein